LIYDAWASTHKEGKKDKTKYQAIKNKKMSDFIKWKRDKSFPYKSLYPNDLSVKRYALCSSGAGLQWNKEGYLDYAGPMGTEDRIFAGFEKVKVPALILKQCSWLNDKEVKALRLKMKKFHAQKQKEEDKLKAFLKKYKLPKEKTVEPIRFELNIYCKLVNMPKNAHKSYVIAGQEICHLIEKSPTESKESKSLAKQFLKRFKKL
jgi:flavodoxin